MPSVLSAFLDELAMGLDDKARTALTQVDAVSALAFLQRITERGDSVRNPSAFIATAVRNAGGRGPGPAELETVMARLRQDGTLDDSAVEALKKGRMEDACQALTSLLTQEASAVRNASAYVTRNIANARKHMGPGLLGGQPMMAPTIRPAMGMNSMTAMVPAGGAGPPGGEALFQKWGPMLDEKAMAALMALSGAAATAVLQEMDSKAASVRNPSAYVQKACENRKEGIGHAASAPDYGPTMATVAMNMGMAGGGGSQMGYGGGFQRGGGGGGGGGGSGYMGSGGGVQATRTLDADAMDALKKVSQEEAAAILANLESRSGSVRNPSAYIVRSVKNLVQEKGGDIDTGSQGGGYGGASAASMPAAFRSSPGSYGQMSQQGYGGGGVPEGGYASMLDESARSALSEVAPEAAEAIMQQLEAQGGKVNNPSAYVLRAVGNARRGKGAGGTAAGGAAASAGLQEELMKLSVALDAKATAALEEVGPAAATAILQKLNKQGGSVNNPNAYIMRAVGNEKRTSPWGADGSVAKRPRF